MLESAIKRVMKETSIGCRAARNLINREQNIRAKIFLTEKVTLKAMRGRSRYITITKRSGEEIV